MSIIEETSSNNNIEPENNSNIDDVLKQKDSSEFSGEMRQFYSTSSKNDQQTNEVNQEKE